MPLVAGLVRAIERFLGLDPGDEPLDPSPQLGRGVGGGVGESLLVEQRPGLFSFESVQACGDLPHPSRVDQSLGERGPAGGGVGDHPVGRGEAGPDLVLRQAHRLTDRHRDRGTLHQLTHR